MAVFQKLDPFQQEAVEWLESRPGAGLFAEQGVGKTWITLGLLERLIEQPKFSALIVVPVTNLQSTWALNLTAELPSLSLAYDWDTFKRLTPPKAFLVGYERLVKIIRRVKAHAWSIVIFDESQRLNKRSSGWSRAARMLRHAQRRLALSGTPIEQSPQDVWAQMRFIDPTVLGEDWGEFASEFMRAGGFMGKQWFFLDRKMPEFLERIRPHCLRISQDVLNLPKSHLHPVRFGLYGNQARVYREMEDDMVTTLAGRTFMAPLRITALIRLQQICGGYLPTDEGDLPVGEAKMRSLRRLIEAGKVKPPFAVFCRYKPEIVAVELQLRKYFDRVEILWGKTGRGKNKSVARGELNQRFQSGQIEALVCQIKAGSVGIDLYRAKEAVIYSTTFSHIDYEQLRMRFVRRGQDKEFDLFFLCAQDTIDDDLFLSLACKHATAESVLSRLKQRRSN